MGWRGRADGEVEDYAVTIEAWADLTIFMGDAPDPVVAGETLTYTLAVTNLGPSPSTGAMSWLSTGGDGRSSFGRTWNTLGSIRPFIKKGDKGKWRNLLADSSGSAYIFINDGAPTSNVPLIAMVGQTRVIRGHTHAPFEGTWVHAEHVQAYFDVWLTFMSAPSSAKAN